MLTTTTASTSTTNRDALDEKANPRYGGMPLGFEAGDVNFYRYVGNRPTTATDPSGLWSLSDHAALTRVVVRDWLDSRRINDRAVREYIESSIVSGNWSQDLQHYNDYRRHYTRPFNIDEWNLERDPSAIANRETRGRQADAEYELYLQAEVSNVTSRWGSMDNRLWALGRLSHSWQDFFAHAVRVDMGGQTRINGGGLDAFNPRRGLRGSENSYWPGFNSFAATDDNRTPFNADPRNRTGLMPSSYGGLPSAENVLIFGLGGLIFGRPWSGEHPGTSEPLISGSAGEGGSAEYRERYRRAQVYRREAMFPLLDLLYDDARRFGWHHEGIGIELQRIPLSPTIEAPRP